MEFLRRLQAFEERLRRQRSIRRLPIGRIRDRSNPLEQFNSTQFKVRYHIRKETALYVTELIKTDLCSELSRGVRLPAIHQLLVFFRYAVTGSFQLVIGDLALVCQPTVSNIVRRVGTAIAKLRRRFIKFPVQSRADSEKLRFYQVGGFPGKLVFHINSNFHKDILLCIHISIFRSNWDSRWLSHSDRITRWKQCGAL